MKKNILQVRKALLALFVLLMPLLASAQTKVEIDGIWYNLDSETKQAEVTYKGKYNNSYIEYSGSITIPATITYNGVAYGVTSIGMSAFYECTDLTDITLPEGVTSIEEYAFSGCDHLTDITLPESMISIGGSAFYDCSRLTDITLPKGVTNIGRWAFCGCSRLTDITLPDGVKVIKEGTFYDCNRLIAISIPASVASIEDNAFSNCTDLTDITLPESMTSIEDYAFEYCESLTAISIPEGTSIGHWAFQYCSSLREIVLPKNVGSIGSQAFANCTDLTNVYCSAESVPSASSSAFDGSYIENATLYVPANAINSYKGIIPWNGFGTFEILNIAVKGITLNHTSVTLIEGETLTFIATVTPENADNTSVTWISDNEAVAMVDNNGQVVAMGLGTATITATANDGSGVSASCKVTVERKITLVSGITLNHTSVTLMEGETLTLTATVNPEDADDTSVTWSSSDEEVAIVSSKGKVVVMGLGTATITATANDGSGVSASCEIIVKAPLLGKCATPTINYIDGEFVLTCSTEGAEIRTTVTTENDNEYIGTKFEYIPTHTFTAYATKENYEDSDVATLTICWIPCSEAHESEETSILTIPSKPVLISARDGVLTLSGLAEGTEVAAYDTTGIQLATATATGGTATLTSKLTTGDIAIVRIGEHSIKVVIK